MNEQAQTKTENIDSKLVKFSSGGMAKLQLFCKPLVSSVGSWGLGNVLQCAWAVDRSVPKCAQKAQCAWEKKLKPLAERFPKTLIRSVFLFVTLSS